MTKPVNRLGIYSDVRTILDAALAAGGGSYQCASRGEAVHWRQRAYRFRKAFTEAYAGESRYDQLVLPRIPDGSSTVTIQVRRQVGLFIPTSNPAPVHETIDDDPLLEEALRLSSDLEGDVI